MRENIVLIGFMAVGKGKTARELARLTGRFAVDTDDLIESLTKSSISLLFEEFGEQYFRDFEQRTARWLAEEVSATIISTGGGFYMVPNLKEIGTVVYLHNEFEHILKSINDHPNRKRKIKKRPLFRNQKRARELYDKRLPAYRAAADMEISVAGKKVKQVAVEIAQRLGLLT